MSTPQFDIHHLLDPAVYPWPVDEVRLIETHISWVLLAGDRVVKLKRPVDLGFVDFRDPARRKQACVDEVRLNKRLTDGVYLGVVPITAAGVDAPGEPLEWATLMRRMPSHRMLDLLLRDGNAPANLAALLADRLIPFHQAASQAIHHSVQDDYAGEEGTQDTNARGRHWECPTDPGIYLTVLTDNLDQVTELGGDILSPAQLALVAASMRAYMNAERVHLDGRFEEWLCEGHGDLRCEHMCLEGERVQIYDCVEFEIAIRCADVASDLAFLLMDLRRLEAQPVADELLARYRNAGFDLPQPVIDLYAAHRALVRAKVAVLERTGDDPERDRNFAFEAASYLDLASAFATPVAPLLVLVSGLSGSGKSTVAAALARITGGRIFASDRVRKELAGLDPADDAQADWHQGIYSAGWTTRTYDRLLQLATEELAQERTAIVDATFLDNAQRDRFAAAAQAQGIPAMMVDVTLDDAIARQRIERRAVERSDPSDATIAIRQRQKDQLRETPARVPQGALQITIDTSADGPFSRDPFIDTIKRAGLLGSSRLEQRGNHA